MFGIDDILRAIVADLHLLALIMGAVYLLAFICAVREVMVSRTSQGSIAWLLSLMLLPIPTVLLYLIFGWKFFDDYATDRMQNGRANRPLRARDLALIDGDTDAKWPVQVQVSELPFLKGNDVELLVDGKATFESIFAGIDAAQDYLLVQFYIVRDDRLGQQLAERLVAKAKAGVAVYMLYDDVGSTGMPRRFRQELRDAGVKLSSFNQRHKFLRLFGATRINYRNHRKIVVADGHHAWVGGHNVGVEYLGEDPKVGHWRDTHVRVSGPAALGCALLFREDWEWATGERLPNRPPSELKSFGDQSVLVMGSGPADKLEECAIAFTDLIGRARKRLWIVSPYFVPDTDIRTALFAARLRGVDVRIMLPDNSDHALVWLASMAHADSMVQHDIAVYRYTDGFLHQKVVLMDDAMATVGSVNFDNRSFAINFEITLWFTDVETIAGVDAMLIKDFESCRRVGVSEVNSRPWALRLATQAARLLSPVL
ncbi:cardiolipin synthase [Devosia subaequoris]|uniref:Cardiolipin synthase n=1 Tax=Devosia subaequoris TaxID=395930 RepID=A0A7W6IJD7_9HYPH|nr:cardiolipin synthase [Devosia subaequoris]MBB4050717.1 cardiolipin synthase [Devosia subaequoris]MCP1208603.1 cardiolipin synthase [Devosia subaequoris]